MTDHPLTDELIDELAKFNSDLTGVQVVNRDHDMRAAADWQLEQVLEWLEKTVDDQTLFGKIIYPHDLKKAMRPQGES